MQLRSFVSDKRPLALISSLTSSRPSTGHFPQPRVPSYLHLLAQHIKIPSRSTMSSSNTARAITGFLFFLCTSRLSWSLSNLCRTWTPVCLRGEFAELTGDGVGSIRPGETAGAGTLGGATAVAIIIRMTGIGFMLDLRVAPKNCESS